MVQQGRLGIRIILATLTYFENILYHLQSLIFLLWAMLLYY